MYRFYLNRCTKSADSIWVIVAAIHIKPVYSSDSNLWTTSKKYDWRGHESPSGYGPLWVFLTLCNNGVINDK